MQLYNATTDTLITNVQPFYKRGFIDHYKAKNIDTGKTVKVSVKELKKEYQNTKYVDVDYLRGNDIGDMDGFMRDTM